MYIYVLVWPFLKPSWSRIFYLHKLYDINLYQTIQNLCQIAHLDLTCINQNALIWHSNKSIHLSSNKCAKENVKIFMPSAIRALDICQKLDVWSVFSSEKCHELFSLNYVTSCLPCDTRHIGNGIKDPLTIFAVFQYFRQLFEFNIEG